LPRWKPLPARWTPNGCWCPRSICTKCGRSCRARAPDRTGPRRARSIPSWTTIVSEGLHPRYLEVRLYDRVCGYLCEAGGNTRFVPSEAFRGDVDRPTLSLSITIPTEAGARATAEVLGNPWHPAVYNTGHALPPYFAGLLPEGELRRRL